MLLEPWQTYCEEMSDFYKFKKVSESLLNRLVIIVIISYLDSAIMVACIVKIKIKAIYHSGGVKLTKIGHSVKRMVNN